MRERSRFNDQDKGARPKKKVVRFQAEATIRTCTGSGSPSSYSKGTRVLSKEVKQTFLEAGRSLTSAVEFNLQEPCVPYIGRA